MAKVKVAFLGTGGFMGVHARRLRAHPDVQLVAMCDQTTAHAESFVERNLKDYAPRPAVFADPAVMYAQARPDAVVIATPHTLHYRHGVQALDAGCHVYMEKPMVTSLSDAYTLRDKVKKVGKTLVVGYNSPCTPEFAFIRDAIRKQTLGKLEMVDTYLSQAWLKPTTGTWRQDPKLSGGGQAYDSGAHLLNSLCWSVESDIEQVFAMVDNHGAAVDINSSIVVRFVNGVTAAVTISGNCPADGSHMSLIFDNGRIDVDGWSGSWINIWQGREKVKYPLIPGKDRTPDDNFIDAILGRAEPMTSPQNGVVQSQLMDAIYESARTGQPARPQRR